jgi:glycosyltransferase involved in cell wall biosynthesis
MNMMPADLPHTSSGTSRSRLLMAAHFVYAGRVGGAEHMFYNLVRGVAQLGTPTTLLCGDIGNFSDTFRDLVDATPTLGFHAAGGGGTRFIAEQRACLDGTLAADAILFPNYYLPPVVPRRLGRTAVVLHDLQYRHFPMYFSARKRAWLQAAQAFALRRADRVFVISDYIRRDVLRVFGQRIAHKLIVAPNPISWTRFETSLEDTPPLDRPYILSVAAQYPHKNLATLIRGFAELAQRQRDVQLVLCGQDYASLHGVGGVRVALRPLIDDLGLGGRVTLTGYLDDAALGRWYRHATLFAFPSLFEGFGMPPVEALGFGLPVLIAGRTALPEVTLGLARSVADAENPSAWAAHMISILQEGRSARLTPLQADHVRQTYSPSVCAARYMDALL